MLAQLPERRNAVYFDPLNPGMLRNGTASKSDLSYFQNLKFCSCQKLQALNIRDRIKEEVWKTLFVVILRSKNILIKFFIYLFDDRKRLVSFDPKTKYTRMPFRKQGSRGFNSVDLLQGFREKVKDASTLFGVSDLEPTNGRWPIHLSLWGSAF